MVPSGVTASDDTAMRQDVMPIGALLTGVLTEFIGEHPTLIGAIALLAAAALAAARPPRQKSANPDLSDTHGIHIARARTYFGTTPPQNRPLP
jgi:hypothetical protein